MSEKNSLKPNLLEASEVKADLRKKEPPLIDLKVTNPITYIKSWWRKIMGGEGIDLRFKIKPLTAMAMTIVIATIGFGVGRFTISMEQPYIKYVSNGNDLSPTPTPKPSNENQILDKDENREENADQDQSIQLRQTAFTGTLKFSNVDKSFYLLTSDSEAIVLETPENVELKDLVGRRVFASGQYNEKVRKLMVTDASDMEVLPKKVENVPLNTEIEEVQKNDAATNSSQSY